MAHAPPGLGAAVDGLDPSLPMPPALRLVLARRALDRHDDPRAQALIAGLGQTPDRLALEGRLADARGDRESAVRMFLAAGDLADLEARIDELAKAGALEAALALQRETVARLARDPTQGDALAQADFALGRLEQRQAYRFPLASPERERHQTSAAQAYERAVALAPLQERYLIAYANELVNAGRLDAAAAGFRRAWDVDPTSAEALAGLGDVAHRQGDDAAARAYLARSRVLDATDAAVRRLARELGA